MGIYMAGNKIRNHFHRNRHEFAVPWIEDAAPYRFIDSYGMLMLVIDFTAVDFGIGFEHSLELTDGRCNHGTIMPGRCLHCFAPEALQTTVKPVQNRKIGLAHPAITPETLCKSDRTAHLHDVHHHLEIIVAPDVPEIIACVFYASPFSVLVKAGFILQNISQTAFSVRFTIPEITKGFFDFFLIHLICPP